MSSSFFALLDDIAVLAKAAAASIDDVVAAAAKASVKSAGVVIDDAAVTPQYVQGISPKRELPVIWRITLGSLVNKAIVIVVAMLFSIWAPWVFPWLLIIGGTYLAYEGTEKVWHWIQQARGSEKPHGTEEVLARTAVDEKQMISSAVRTDLVLSTEIMLIALASIDTDSWVMRLSTLIVVALAMTVLVYGSVALLVKMDDVGMWMAKRRSAALQSLGGGIVRAMPWVFRGLSIVGVVAMLWVGGHILLTNLAEVGVAWPLEITHTAVHALGDNPVVNWFTESGIAAVFGLIWGAVVVVVLMLIARFRFRAPQPAA